MIRYYISFCNQLPFETLRITINNMFNICKFFKKRRTIKTRFIPNMWSR